MSGKAGALVIRFVGDLRDLSKSTVKVNKTLGGVGKIGLGVAAGVGAATVAVGALAAATTKDMMRVERLGKQTENVINATGGAAGRTRKQVDAMAGRLEKMTGAEAEAVTEGQNMLLTFKNIKGKNFDLATKSMLDMGVAMNKGSLEGLDLSKTSIQMGKALNDPIKGITALSKVGVSFTDSQKKQIKAMQEAGDMAGAQKIILKELKSEFGGAAKAAGQTTEGMIAKIKNTFGNIAESTLSFVLPAMMKLMGFVNRKVMPALERFGVWLKNDGAAHLRTFGAFLREKVLPPLQVVGGFIANSVVPAFVRLGKWIARNRDWLGALVIGVTAFVGVMKIAAVIGTVTKAMKAFTVASMLATIQQWSLVAAIRANPFVAIISGIIALVAALVWFFTKTKLGQKIVRVAWSAIKSAIKGVADWWTKTAWPAIRGALSAMGDWFKMVGRVAVRAWKGTARGLGDAWQWIRKNVFDRVRFGILVLRVAFFVGRKIIVGHFTAMRERLASVGSWIRKNVFGRIGSALGAMKRAFRNAKDGIARIWAGLKAAAKSPVKFLIHTVWNQGLRKMINAIPGVKDIKPTKFATGGAVRGGTPGRDSVRALMMPGEHVWTAKEVRAAGGQQAMYRMREAVLKGNLNGDPKFAKGGALSSDAIAKAQAFARQQSGKPYGWGAVGPTAYDCSGFMSALTNVLRGQPAHRRVGATNSFPWAGFERGPGQFTIGSTKNYGGSGIGHMAGNLAGMGVESRGGRGVLVGPAAMSPNSPGFSGQWHLGAGGRNAGAGAGWLDAIKTVLGTVKRLPGQITEMIGKGGWMVSLLKKAMKSTWSDLAGYLNRKIPNVGFGVPDNPIPRKFARGGIVRARAGGVHAILGEAGYDEMVTPMAGPNAPRGRREVHHVSLDGEFGDFVLKVLRSKVKSGGGDPVFVLSGGRRSS